jgi:hypothetical protein
MSTCLHSDPVKRYGVEWCPTCGAIRKVAGPCAGSWHYSEACPEVASPHTCEDFVWNAPSNSWRCIECRKPYVRGYGEHDQPELGTDDGG